MADLYKKTTDELFAWISPEDLAVEIGCSVNTVKQARLSEGTKGKRTPPPGWERAVAKLAERQAAHFTKLAKRLSPN